jgi:TolA-binding protein
MSFSFLTTSLQAVDTVVAVTPRDPLAVAVDVAVLLMAVGVALLALLGAFVLRRVNRQIGWLRRTVEGQMSPVSDRARAISDNVEYVTQVLRTDVARLNTSITSLSERLQQASDRMEERVEEFNALMGVVQSEAEDIFLDTASAVRGVREGARSMTGGEPGRGRRRGVSAEEAGARAAGGSDEGSGATAAAPGPGRLRSPAGNPEPEPERRGDVATPSPSSGTS